MKKQAAAAFRRTAISVAVGMCLAGVVHAQSADGSIVGKAKAEATVTLTSPGGKSTQAKARPDGSIPIFDSSRSPRFCGVSQETSNPAARNAGNVR